MKTYKVGIIGAGSIARAMAATVNGMGNVTGYAIASRDIRKAEEFARQWHFERAHGSYQALIDDPEVDLIYIATPHSHHYEQARQCIEAGKPVLCEKAFTANAAQAEALLRLAEERNVFITEAIWTRYMPFSRQIADTLRSGIIGNPYLLTANLGYPIRQVERLQKPELAGGALLDVGIYTLNFAAMLFGTDIERTESACMKALSGVDAQDCITLYYPGERMAVLTCSMYACTDRLGIVSGEKGHLIVENINNPQRMKVVDNSYRTIAEYAAPPQITGYEYEVEACIEAIANGWKESPHMPHAETLRIMKQMDSLRADWGIRYPFE